MAKWLCLAVLAASVAVQAASPQELAGQYELQGVREAGSSLLLRADGRFQWSMHYGAIDQLAVGQWQRQGSKVVLKTALPPEEPSFRVFEEHELAIRQPAAPGSWVAIVGMPRVGPLPEVEVTFEAADGSQRSAVTDRNGDAEVSAVPGQRWVRAGLRRLGSQAPQQWLPLPPLRSEQSLAAFAVDDEAYIRPPAFHELSLRVDGRQLVLDEGRDSRMVYRRR